MVTLSLPCFSSIFRSATTRVSTFRPPTLLELMGDLFALPDSSVAGVANSSGIMKRSPVGGLGASRMLKGEGWMGGGSEGVWMNWFFFPWLLLCDQRIASGVDWTGSSLPMQLLTSQHKEKTLNHQTT